MDTIVNKMIIIIITVIIIIINAKDMPKSLFSPFGNLEVKLALYLIHNDTQELISYVPQN